MKKIDWQKAIIEPNKLVKYLLNPTHQRGRTKAAFFHNYGFTGDNWQALADLLYSHVKDGNAEVVEITKYGTLFKAAGMITSSTKRTIILQSIWLVDNGKNIPRFITAYPIKIKIKA